MDTLVTQPAEGTAAAPMSSPFLGAGYLAEAATPAAGGYVAPPLQQLVSPFAEALVDVAATAAPDALELLVGELQDESFDEAVSALVDEAAALHLTVPWASESASGAATIDAWASRLTAETGRLLDGLTERFENRTVESITAGELDVAAAELMSGDYSPAAEQLFGGIFDKVKKAVGSVAKAGLGALAKFTGLGQLTGILKKLAAPLVKRVVGWALNKLPAAARGPARALAAKLGVPVTGELSQDFDRQLAVALTAPNDAALEELFTAADAAAELSTEDPVAELDAARAQLVDDLLEATPGEPPVVAVERFIPAVMAVMPLVRTAVKIIGRNRMKNMLAGPLASFIAPFIGRAGAQSLAPHIADAGMRLLKLEREDRAVLGAEALVSTIEETARQVLSLPAESLADDLRAGAEVQEAFAEAAADYLPGRMLRSDRESGGADDENEGWVLMPRAARPHFRYRAHTRPYAISVSRPTARTIVFAEDETLEDRLLDEGVTSWPAEVQVRLFEAIPGTHAGHLGADEQDVPTPAGEFGELTPEAAGMLLRNPALGRRAAGAGRRFFQVLSPGRRPHHRVRRFGLRLDVSGAAPVLRVHLRIGERAAHLLAGQLDQRAHTQVVTTIRRILGAGARRAIAGRLGRLRTLHTPAPLSAERCQAIADALAEAMITTVARELPAAGAALIKAAQDPAAGLTLTFAFPYRDLGTLRDGSPGAPSLTIRAGLHRD